MHICHVVYSLHIGGLERVLINCVNRLPADIQHTVICLTDYSSEFRALLPERVEIVTLNKRPGHDWRLYQRFYHCVQKVRPDIVHTYNLATLEMQWVAWFARVNTRIHAEHGRDIYDPNGSNKKYQWLRRLVAPFVHKFVAVSKELHDWLLNDVALKKKKCALIRNGIDTDFFVPSCVEQNHFVVGHVGRLSPIKNQSLLLRSFALAGKQDPAFETQALLHIVGGGECETALRQESERLGLADKVVFAGPQSNVLSYYQKFSVFVLSSLGEGIPMTLLEAMSCATPAIVTHVGGMPEVVDESVGKTVASDDEGGLAKALLEAFQQQALWHQKGAKARDKIIHNFSEQVMVDAYLALYNKGA